MKWCQHFQYQSRCMSPCHGRRCLPCHNLNNVIMTIVLMTNGAENIIVSIVEGMYNNCFQSPRRMNTVFQFQFILVEVFVLYVKMLAFATHVATMESTKTLNWHVWSLFRPRRKPWKLTLCLHLCCGRVRVVEVHFQTNNHYHLQINYLCSWKKWLQNIFQSKSRFLSIHLVKPSSHFMKCSYYLLNLVVFIMLYTLAMHSSKLIERFCLFFEELGSIWHYQHSNDGWSNVFFRWIFLQCRCLSTWQKFPEQHWWKR